MKVRHILATKGSSVLTVQENQLVREVIALMDARRIGAVLVVDPAGQLAGIFSERDVLHYAAQDEQNLFARPVSDLMTRKLITGSPQDDVYSVAHTMTERRIRHLPILDEGRLVGIVSIGDILKAQRDAYRGEIDTLETQLLES